MKRFAFIYSDSCDCFFEPHCSYENRIHIEEERFPKGTTDWEIINKAKRKVEDRTPSAIGMAGHSHFSRKLIRVIEISRDIDIQQDTP